MDQDNPTNQGAGVRLDGSFGTGVLAELTIITKAGEGGQEKEVTYTFPYYLIDFETLQRFDRFHLIKGYRIVKQEKPTNPELKEFGL